VVSPINVIYYTVKNSHVQSVFTFRVAIGLLFWPESRDRIADKSPTIGLRERERERERETGDGEGEDSKGKQVGLIHRSFH
jgi:hypothetical protein